MEGGGSTDEASERQLEELRSFLGSKPRPVVVPFPQGPICECCDSARSGFLALDIGRRGRKLCIFCRECPLHEGRANSGRQVGCRAGEQLEYILQLGEFLMVLETQLIEVAETFRMGELVPLIRCRMPSRMTETTQPPNLPREPDELLRFTFSPDVGSDWELHIEHEMSGQQAIDDTYDDSDVSLVIDLTERTFGAVIRPA